MEGGGEVGWYVLGPNQEHVGPYALSELRGILLFLPWTPTLFRPID
jgi:hypothetical protein